MKPAKRFLPAPLLIAALVCAAFPVMAAPPGDKAPQAAVNPAAFRAIRLTTGVVDGRMVFLDEKGRPNPKLQASVGDTLEITLSSGEGAQHDLVIPGFKVASAK